MKQAMNDVDDDDDDGRKVEKKDCVRGMKYKRLSASQSSHLCILFTVLHKYIQRYAIIRTLETQLRYTQSAHSTAQHDTTNTQERQKERTYCGPIKYTRTNFHNFF